MPVKLIYRTWNKNRKLLIKLLSVSAATAIAIRFFYTDNFAAIRNDARVILNDEKLISVHMFTRHGARTPLHIIKGLEEAEYTSDLLEPYVKAKYKLKTLENEDFEDIISYYDHVNYKNKLKGGAGRGQLTKVGEKQMFDLGRRIREKYIDKLKFISPYYDTNQLYARSSHYKRTINSAKSFLAGLYCESHLDEPENPFIINVHKLHDDCLFPNALSCSYLAQMYQFIEKLDLYTSHLEYIENLNQLIDKLKNYGDNSNLTFTMFRDDMSARKVHNLPVPSHLEELFEKSDRYASIELTSSLRHNIKISCGRLLLLIKNSILETHKNDLNDIKNDYQKFRYFSAHDSSLNAILCAFDYMNDSNESWPPFAAHIEIELWKNLRENNEYFVRVYYCDKPVIMPGCRDQKCKLEKFLEILNQHAINDQVYSDLCSQSFVGSV